MSKENNETPQEEQLQETTNTVEEPQAEESHAADNQPQ